MHCSLHTLADWMTSYAGTTLTENVIKENVDIIYQILEAGIENGHLIHDDVGVLKRLVKPRGWVDELVGAVTGSTSTSHQTISTIIPWRIATPHYTNNEVFLDLVEELDAVLSTNGIVHAVISANLYLSNQLSGTPDLLLHLSGATRNLEEESVSFHPCVRLQRWKRDRVISFVPFEGGPNASCGGRIMTYSLPLTNSAQLPLLIKANHEKRGDRGTLQITLNPKIPLTDVVIVVTLANVTNVQARSSMGEWRWEQVPGTVGRGLWGVGKIGEAPVQNSVIPNVISMSINYEMEDSEGPFPTIFADFHSLPGHSVSGVRVDTLQLLGETYVPFKGCKMVVRSGRYTMRV